jgi:hypothetical protein
MNVFGFQLEEPFNHHLIRQSELQNHRQIRKWMATISFRFYDLPSIFFSKYSRFLALWHLQRHASDYCHQWGVTGRNRSHQTLTAHFPKRKFAISSNIYVPTALTRISASMSGTDVDRNRIHLTSHVAENQRILQTWRYRSLQKLGRARATGEKASERTRSYLGIFNTDPNVNKEDQGSRQHEYGPWLGAMIPKWRWIRRPDVFWRENVITKDENTTINRGFVYILSLVLSGSPAYTVRNTRCVCIH